MIERSYPSQEDVKLRVISAICKFYRHDQELLDVNANESSITHKLAEYLQQEFPGWNVDCESNRKGYKPKRIQIDAWKTFSNDIEAKTIYPDIVIHQRLSRQNLVVIEVKKSNGNRDSEDIKKLKDFTESQQYKYKYGIFFILGIDRCLELRIFKDGIECSSWTEKLQEALKELGYGR